MPVNQKLMANLKREYGPDKGEDIYYAMENKKKHKKKKHKKKKKARKKK